MHGKLQTMKLVLKFFISLSLCTGGLYGRELRER